eukprot:scaffold91038_cov26-Tisochrysis_lutea.AAC.2
MLSHVCACGNICAIAAVSTWPIGVNGICTDSTSVPGAGSRSEPVQNLMKASLSAGAHPSSTAHSAWRRGVQSHSSSSSTTRKTPRMEKAPREPEGAPQTTAASCFGEKRSGAITAGGNTDWKPDRSSSNCQPPSPPPTMRLTDELTYFSLLMPTHSSSSAKSANSASLMSSTF